MQNQNCKIILKLFRKGMKNQWTRKKLYKWPLFSGLLSDWVTKSGDVRRQLHGVAVHLHRGTSQTSFVRLEALMALHGQLRAEQCLTFTAHINQTEPNAVDVEKWFLSNFYCPQTDSQDGSVFTGICSSVILSTSGEGVSTSHTSCYGRLVKYPLPRPQTSDLGTLPSPAFLDITPRHIPLAADI